MQALKHSVTTILLDTEPFKGLFTQGMVCHETYKDTNDTIGYSPDEIVSDNE